MPQKACERGFCHVTAFSQFFEMPQNRRISFSFIFCFKIDHVLIFWNAHFSHFQNQIRKMRHFNRKWSSSILGHFKKLKNAVTWQNPLSHAFWGISWYLVYYTGCTLKLHIFSLKRCNLSVQKWQKVT